MVFNSPPEGFITSHQEGMTLQEGEIVLFRGSASDPNHGYEDLTAAWFINGEEVCLATTPEEDGATSCNWEVVGDTVLIQLEIKDALNAAGSASLQLEVIPTATPEASIISPSAGASFYADQAVAFEGLATDEEDDSSDLIVTWSVDGELSEEMSPSSDGSVSTERILTEGSHFIELAVTDTSGKVGRDSLSLEIGPANTPPSCEILLDSDQVFELGELINFSAQASDPNIAAEELTMKVIKQLKDKGIAPVHIRQFKKGNKALVDKDKDKD